MSIIHTISKLLLNKTGSKLSKQRVDYLLSALALSALSNQALAADNEKGYEIDVSQLAKAQGVEINDISKVEITLSDPSQGEIIALGNGVFQFVPAKEASDVSFMVSGDGIANSFTSSFSAAAEVSLQENFAKSWNDFIDSLSATDSAATSKIDVDFDMSALGLGILALAAGGSGGAGSGGAANVLATLSGVASHGTLENARVFLDLDGDSVWDANEVYDITDDQGQYDLSDISAADQANGTLVVRALSNETIDGVTYTTTDAISGSNVENLVMKAQASATVITPLTTLVEAGLSNADALDILGLDDTAIDINSFNPFSTENDGTANAIAFEKVATKLFTTVNSIAEAIDSSAGDDLNSTEGFVLAMSSVATKMGEEIAVRAANDAVDVEAAALQVEVAALQAIVDAAGEDVTAEQTAAVTAKELEVTTKEAEKTAEQDLDLTDAATIAAVATTAVTAADTQIKAVKAQEKAVLEAEAAALQAIIDAAGEDVTAEQTAAVTAKELEVTAKNVEATTDKVSDEVTALVTTVSKAIVNVNTEIDSITAFDVATAKDTLNMGAETLVTQVKAAVDSGTTISLAADTLETLSEDDTSITFTAVAGAATSLTGFYGDISNDSGSTWTYTLHTSESHGQAQSDGDSYQDTFTITDSNNDTHAVTVSVFGKDDAAVITAADDTIAEGTATVSATATHTDVDSDDDDNVFTAVSTATDSANGYGTYTVTSAGVWTYTLNNDHATIDALGASESTTDTITVTSGDGTTENITITITGTNDAPVITSSATASAPENGTAAAIITATDAESDDITYSISGTDSALFSIVPSTGVLTFNTAPDYELIDPVADDNTYSLTVTASDGTVSVDQALTVTVTNVEGGPVFSSAETVAVDENQTAVLTLTASDDENDTIAFTISGGDDSDSFSLTGGVLTFAASPNYEVKSSYSVTVTASETTDTDGATIASPNTTDQAITVSINDINDAAVITAADGTIAEGTATVSATATHTDADTGNDDNTFLAVTDVASTYGTYSVTSAGVWTYTLNSSNATIDALGASQSATDTITVTAEDGTTEDVTITITGTNDAAVIAGTTTGAVTEDASTTTATGTLTHTDVDANNDANVFTAVSTATDSANGYGTYTMTAAGDWTYTLDNTNATVSALAAAATTTDTFAVTAEDGTSQTVTVTITGVNDAPTTVADSETIAEDASATVISVLANDSDPEGTTLTLASKSAATNGGTVLDNGDGTVSYTPATNFNGSDTFTYTATDGTDTSTSTTVTVTVTAVNDDPTGAVSIAGTAKTGSTLTASNTLADVDGLGTISYQWAKDGTDVSGATNSTLVLDDDDLGSTFTVTASYTDDDGTAESATSDASGTVVDMVKLIQVRNITTMTAAEASIAINGEDYSSGSTETIAAFDLYLDAEGVDSLNASASEVYGTEFTLGFTASDLDSVTTFASEENATWTMEIDEESFTIYTANKATGAVALGDSSALVDIDTSNDTGRSTVLIEQKIGTVYINPADGVDDIQLTLQDMLIDTGDVNVEPLNYSVDVL
jgi:VCBS repeat-containing protein